MAHGGFQFDARSHHLELDFIQLMSERATIKGKLGAINLRIAQNARDYARHNNCSRDEAQLILMRLLKICSSDGPNFSI